MKQSGITTFTLDIFKISGVNVEKEKASQPVASSVARVV